DVDVGQARHAEAAEQGAGAPRLPHQRAVDDRPALDGLEWVPLDPGAGPGRLADEALVAEHHALLAPHAVAQVAAAADGGAPQAHALADVGVVVDDRPLEVRPGPDPDVGAEHGVLAQPGVALDPAVVADDDRPLDAGVGVDVGPLPDVDAVADLGAGGLHVDPPVEHVLVGPHVGLQRAHVLPVALDHGAVQRPLVLQQAGDDIGAEGDREAGG